MEVKDFIEREKEYSETKVWNSLVLWRALSSEAFPWAVQGAAGEDSEQAGQLHPGRPREEFRLHSVASKDAWSI